MLKFGRNTWIRGIHPILVAILLATALLAGYSQTAFAQAALMPGNINEPIECPEDYTECRLFVPGETSYYDTVSTGICWFTIKDSHQAGGLLIAQCANHAELTIGKVVEVYDGDYLKIGFFATPVAPGGMQVPAHIKVTRPKTAKLTSVFQSWSLPIRYDYGETITRSVRPGLEYTATVHKWWYPGQTLAVWDPLIHYYRTVGYVQATGWSGVEIVFYIPPAGYNA